MSSSLSIRVKHFNKKGKTMYQEEFHRGAISPGDCISNGWTLISQNYGIFLGMSTLAFFTVFFINCIPFLGVFINAVISGPIFVGIYYCCLKKMRGEDIDFGMMFFGFQRFLPAMVISLFVALPWIILQIAQLFFNVASFASGLGNSGQSGGSLNSMETILAGMSVAFILLIVFLIIVGIVVNVLMFFALPLIADREISPGDAIKLSAKAAMGNILGIILLFILEFFIALAGVFALCIGILFVLPLIYAANAFAFRQVFPQTDNHLNYSPPSPQAYGSNFGQGQ
jgi:accessory gene regulator protein AgrB